MGEGAPKMLPSVTCSVGAKICGINSRGINSDSINSDGINSR